ncbi:putative permease [Anoxybacillus ayderensis]|uniref:hypothetical protein n=1 Tax=Anoxybacillus ayderensis TaxID=265546 RepID=UPI000386C69E|nr:hypothetical protein [Anoxybacillus ayderensis]EPZ38956.1 putative permease [Anoxybacillus ayderensis]
MKRWSSFIRESIEHMISIKWIVVGIVFYFYGVRLKKEIVQAACEQKVSFNNWDITLRLLSDAYLIVYFITPVTLFFLIRSLFLDFDYQVFIRLGSFKKWVYRSLRNFWINVFSLLFLWFFMALFMAIGFSHSWNWSDLSKAAHFTNTLEGLVNFFSYPAFAFFAQFVLLLFTFSLLHIVFSIMYVLTKNKGVIIFMSVLFFLFNIVGFKLFPTELAFLLPVTFFSIANALNAFHSLESVYIIVIAVLVFCICLLPFLDLNKRPYIRAMKSYIPIVFYFSLCIMGIGVTAQSLVRSSDITILDVFVMSFAGVSAERFAYIPFFFYAVVFFGFTYLLQLFFLSNELEQLSYYKIIRFRSLNKWFWSWMKKFIVITFFFLMILFVLSLAVAVCFQTNIDGYVTLLSKPLHEMIYHFFMNGFLQIMFYISLIFIVSWISNESIYGVVLISICMIVMLPRVNVNGIIPIGLNSMVYLVDYSPYYLTMILMIANVMSFFVIHRLLKQSLKI